jgi:hypothetical protein
MAVCDMACCSGPFRRKLQVAWINYIYKFNWDELEALLLEEDRPKFKRYRKLLETDIVDAISERVDRIMEQTMSAPRPLSREQAQKHSNAEIVIRGMSGNRAKNSVRMIVEMYKEITFTLELRNFVQKNMQKSESQ